MHLFHLAFWIVPYLHAGFVKMIPQGDACCIGEPKGSFSIPPPPNNHIVREPAA